jgi:hypothetical protein
MEGGCVVMVQELENQIRQALSDCEIGKLSLDEFRKWFVPVSWNIEQSNDAATIDLAHRIDGILAEASSANWSDDDLREELSEIARLGSTPYTENRSGDPSPIRLPQSNAQLSPVNRAQPKRRLRH